MSKMPVPDELLQFFAQAQRGKCQVAFDASSVTITAGGKSRVLSRPCSMPEIEAAAREVTR